MVKDRDREVRDQAKGKAVEERVIVEEEKENKVFFCVRRGGRKNG